MASGWDNVIPVFDPADLFGTKAKARTDNANSALDAAKEQMDLASSKNTGLYNDYYNTVKQTYGGDAADYNTYKNRLAGMEAYDPGQFEYTGSVNDFYSKAANQRINDAMNQFREANGDIFSSAYNDRMLAKQTALASEEWDKAYNRYTQDRQTALNEWNANAQAGQQAYNNQYNQNKDLLSIASNGRDNITNAYGNYISNMTNQNNIDAQNAGNLAMQRVANENANNKSLISRLFG